jgi:RimJ/RimL family protein N-acetyltransferase
LTSPGGAPAPTELPFPDPPLSDGVVARRPWTDTDLDFIVAACQDPEIARFSPVIPVPYTEADALQWLELMDSIRLADSGLDLAITGVADGEMLGAIGIGRLDRMLATADIGYWLAREARGQGHMSRAVRLLVRWGFEELGLARIALTTTRRTSAPSEWPSAVASRAKVASARTC